MHERNDVLSLSHQVRRERNEFLSQKRPANKWSLGTKKQKEKVKDERKKSTTKNKTTFSTFLHKIRV